MLCSQCHSRVKVAILNEALLLGTRSFRRGVSSALDTANHLSDCFRFQTPIGYELLMSRFNLTIEHDVYTSRGPDLVGQIYC
jgi:hypothetical protein